jgi:tetraacyldisaccharide 4'-kinase
MLKEPWFWRDQGLAARIVSASLAPAALLYDVGQRTRRVLARPAALPIPVICVGNATLGGVGKTPFALYVRALLKKRGLDAHFLSRGHGGAMRGPIRVLDQHTAEDVGDEALLLARAAPTWIAKARSAGARAAAAAGAAAIIMDDGFQNPTIRHDCALLLIDCADPKGNGRVFPAGPLREPLRRARRRADALVLVGAGASPLEAEGRPAFRATATIAPPIARREVVAFCGIGRPQRFFAALEAAGYRLAGRISFADHHPYRATEIAALSAAARKADAALITTEKDVVRIPPDLRDDIIVAPLMMTVDEPEALADFVLAKAGAR